MLWLYVLLAAVGLLVIWMIAFYNRAVTLHNKIDESWSNVDTELRRRYELIPNLVATVKGYASHERDVLDAVVRARADAVKDAGRPGQQAEHERPLVKALGRLFAVAEAYPDLKASSNFMQLQEELVITEDRIQASRRFYNANVRTHRDLIRQFPNSVLANLFRFGPRDFFEVEPVHVKAPKVTL